MAKKKRLRERITDLEIALEERVTSEPPSFDNLTICWSKRTVEFRGRTVMGGEQDYLVFPIAHGRYVITDVRS